MAPENKSKKKKGKLSKEQKEKRKECRREANEIHETVNSATHNITQNVISTQVNKLLEDLGTPRAIQETSATIRKLLELAGTDLEQNDNDPFGDGDQSGCGRLGLIGESIRQILRSLFAQGGDLDSYLCFKEGAFSPFGYACATGDVSKVEHMLKVTETGSEERMQLLERRETGMRFSPLCLTTALYKSRQHVSMRLHIPVSQMDHVAVFKMLLKYGAAPDAKEATGKTVVHYAAGVMANQTTLDMCDFCIDAAKSSRHFGKDIILRNLSKDEYNGLEGNLGGYICDTGRRVVILKNRKSLALKPENIFFGEGDEEKCIHDETRNVVNDQDRVGMISLHEVFMSARLDVAQYLTEKRNASIDIKCRGGTSVRSMAYNMGFVSDMSRLIRKYGTHQSRQKHNACALCGKSDGIFSKCARCKKTTYCSAECQRADWKVHKKECKPPSVKSVKLTAPTTSLIDQKLPDWRGEYKRPDGVEIDETFWLKVQLCQNGSSDAPHLVYDKSRACAFYLQCEFPGHQEIAERVKEEDTYMGLKAYFRASFGQDGNCTVFLDETGLKNW
jgi:hypothetical protein